MLTIQGFVVQAGNNKWRFGCSWPKAWPAQFNPSAHVAAPVPGGSADPVYRRTPPTQGQLSRDILYDKSAARPSLGGAQLRFFDSSPDRRAGGRGGWTRPLGFGADRLRQDGGLWPRDRAQFARGCGAVRECRRAPGLDRRADAGTRTAGAARTRLALSIC